ncbi:glycosyltransferase family protein [Schinkia azotoformans]|uniref:hypothetical protein n=1 Tax=Schinkia azotoformans TaxID=1454 RepID=UPI002DBC1582|nr:hypothetical protein [Schinkia azotoformans]MEC1714815.1 hypothetical protein [Schinkia azotoformans]MEC1741721.1 hypothetical protein [Schinkia azotoformans]MEC1766601.1 hypothetical protein [Schinkia azotoformans]MEC1788016.1 hypothetical protein [Schinkia azotoformans]MED4375418.1 hypothetical protein [Schinkia azotoformans]
MRILHAPENIGGMAGVLAKAQRNLGHEAYSYSFITNQFKFKSDYVLNNPTSYVEKIQKAASFAHQFDVFHFYFGSSLLGNSLKDVSWLSKMGKKIFFYFCGCEIRDEKIMTMKYSLSSCVNCFPKLCSKNRKLAKDVAEKFGIVNFVSTPDLLEFVDRSVLLPQVVNFELIEKVGNESIKERSWDEETLVIAHAPTNRLIKGTSYLIDSVEELKKIGYKIELLLIENMSHEEAIRNYRRADIAVDQLLAGAYGQVSAELMALGVPTIAYLREDLIDKYPEVPPLINANPFTIKEKIMEVYENRDMLKPYKKNSKYYAYNIHHPTQIALKSLEYYQ